MIAIALSFSAGRFHATPWGRPVNEGAPEWPPSPWRILRSLVATWKRKLDDRFAIGDIRPVLGALATPPHFRLPRASTGHTRHYMPLRFPDQGDRTKVFDAFVVIPRREELVMLWPEAVLSEAGQETLGTLVSHLGFLGRAESWCEARLLNDAQAQEVKVNCAPLNGHPPEAGQEIVRLLCGHPSAAFDNAHTPKVPLAMGGKKGKKGPVGPLYDPDWHLCLETSELHDKRWSDPPGSMWVRYLLRSDCFAVTPVKRMIAVDRPRPQVARFSLDSTVLPLSQDTLPTAERARWSFPKTSTFYGKDEAGTRRTDGHLHARFLPTDEDGDGRLDHLTIVAEEGFGDAEMRALDQVRKLKNRKGDDASAHPVGLILMGLGRLDEFTPFPLTKSSIWVSATPFLAPRHPKARGTKRDAPELLHDRDAFLIHVLKEELERRGLKAVQITPIKSDGVFRIEPKRWALGDATGSVLRPIQFRRFRQKRSDDGGRRLAGSFRIEFESAVSGPICLGHSSHFGMGLFLPAVK